VTRAEFIEHVEGRGVVLSIHGGDGRMRGVCPVCSGHPLQTFYIGFGDPQGKPSFDCDAGCKGAQILAMLGLTWAKFYEGFERTPAKAIAKRPVEERVKSENELSEEISRRRASYFDLTPQVWLRDPQTGVDYRIDFLGTKRDSVDFSTDFMDQKRDYKFPFDPIGPRARVTSAGALSIAGALSRGWALYQRA
jgi:hypothetical protein